MEPSPIRLASAGLEPYYSVPIRFSDAQVSAHDFCQIANSRRDVPDPYRTSEFKILICPIVGDRPVWRAGGIGIAGFGELRPLAPHRLAERPIIRCVHPVGWKRVREKQQLLAVVCPKLRALPGLRESEVIEVRMLPNATHGDCH